MDLKELKYTKHRLDILAKLGLESVEAVLSYYPFRYDQLALMEYKDFKEGERVVFQARLIKAPSTYRRGPRSITRFSVLTNDEQELFLTIFNRPWAKNINPEHNLIFIGIYQGERRVSLINYYDKDPNLVLGIIPIYPLKNGVSQNDIRKIIDFTIKNKGSLDDRLSRDLEDRHGLISYDEAIKAIHRPQSIDDLKKALARLKYSEFLKFYLNLLLLKSDKETKRPLVRFDRTLIDDLILKLPYELTKDQKQAVEEILSDLSSDHVMYRLLEGDVGSGKTIVAAIALLANYLRGKSGAIMVPTEILAKQHYKSLKEVL